MNTNPTSKLKVLYEKLKPGTPVSARELLDLNISRDLLVYYVKSGWLERLSNGVYVKPNTELSFEASLCFLQNYVQGLHVGGKSALDWYGIRHYLSNQPTTYLYAWESTKLPEWFSSTFKCKFRRKRLFDESPHSPLCVSHFNNKESSPKVSEPERAVLEMLSEVPTEQSLSEAAEIMEGAFNLRPEVMSELLSKCKSVKTVRLFLKLAASLSLPAYEAIKNQKFPTGSESPWVCRSGGKTMVLKP